MTSTSPSRSHRDLLVWQRAIALACACYRAAKLLPRSERFELGSQLRTSAASVSSNIAEGKRRRTPAEFARFLAIARGSAGEVDSHLELGVALGFLERKQVEEAEQLADEVIRMLSTMMRKLSPL